MDLDNHIIYYFSGTGNSLAVAKSICVSNPEFQLIPIASFRNQKELPVTGVKIGLVFPLYFAGLPLIVKQFMEKLSFTQDCYIFSIVTCGFPWSGFALHQMNRILRKKKQKLAAGFYLKMVDNFLVKYQIPSLAEQRLMAQQCEAKLETMNRVIQSNETRLDPERGFLLYLMYPLFLKFIHRYDALFRTGGKCNACGICAKVCPVNNVEVGEIKPKWLHKCEFCMACINCCPKQAIQWGKFTLNRGRYHHPDIQINEIINQKSALS